MKYLLCMLCTVLMSFTLFGCKDEEYKVYTPAEDSESIDVPETRESFEGLTYMDAAREKLLGYFESVDDATDQQGNWGLIAKRDSEKVKGLTDSCSILFKDSKLDYVKIVKCLDINDYIDKEELDITELEEITTISSVLSDLGISCMLYHRILEEAIEDEVGAEKYVDTATDDFDMRFKLVKSEYNGVTYIEATQLMQRVNRGDYLIKEENQ